MIVKDEDFLKEPLVKMFLDSFEKSIDPVVITSKSPQHYFLYVNEAFKKQTGYSETELFDKTPRILQGEKTNRNVLDELKKKLSRGESFRGQNINYTKNGQEYIVKWFISPLKDHNGDTVAYISFQKEIKHSNWAQSDLILLSSTIDQVDQAVVVTNIVGEITYVNKAFENKYGFLKSETIGKNINFLKSGKQSRSFYKDVWDTLVDGRSYHGVFINKNKNGELFYEQKTITPIKDQDGHISHYVSVAQDITKLVSKKTDYKQKAYTDPLTSLGNRLKLDEFLDERLKEFRSTNDVFSLIMLDIDDFKLINDTYGHDKGDEVLKNLAKILKDQLRRDDLVVRWGGEEFAVVVGEGQNIAYGVSEKIRLAISNKLKIESKAVTASLGVTQVREDDTKDTLFKRVDDALYKSKKIGKNQTNCL